jgi:hypothetical protein
MVSFVKRQPWFMVAMFLSALALSSCAVPAIA